MLVKVGKNAEKSPKRPLEGLDPPKRRAPADGGLRVLFRKNLPQAQWTPVETGGTAGGVPDSEYCFRGGEQGWIEFKRTNANAVKMRPGQIAWISRRARLGGRVFIAVRKVQGVHVDELHLFRGEDVIDLATRGCACDRALIVEEGGPEEWGWALVRELLGGG